MLSRSVPVLLWQTPTSLRQTGTFCHCEGCGQKLGRVITLIEGDAAVCNQPIITIATLPLCISVSIVWLRIHSLWDVNSDLWVHCKLTLEFGGFNWAGQKSSRAKWDVTTASISSFVQEQTLDLTETWLNLLICKGTNVRKLLCHVPV